MTTLERAQKLALSVMQHAHRVNYMEMTSWIQRVLDEAVADEREACAKIAEDDDFIIAGRAYATAEDTAKRIRARSAVKS